MTLLIPIEAERAMKRPVEEVAIALLRDAEDYGVQEAIIEWEILGVLNPRLQAKYRSAARAVLAHLTQLGFLNDLYFEAKKAEEAETK